jgi:AcrR family transcriptional regulator
LDWLCFQLPDLKSKDGEMPKTEGMSARERLLKTARELFYQEGPRAVGIDRVLAESGVAKMSLYRYFPSKDDLITTCLREHDQEYWENWDATVARVKGGPVEKLRAILQRLAKRSSQSDYRGCAFLNTAVDFADPSHPARIVSVEHKRKLYERLFQLTKEADARDPKQLARQLLLLINGAQATSGMLGKEVQHALVTAGEALFFTHGLA